MDYIRAKREVRHALVISDPTPVDSVQKMWVSVGQAASIGIFLLPFGALLAMPLSIVGLVVFNHLVPTEEVKLPD